MDPELERSLFQRITRIERKITVIAGLVISGTGLGLAYLTAHTVGTEWGWGDGWGGAIGAGTWIVVAAYYGHLMDKQ